VSNGLRLDVGVLLYSDFGFRTHLRSVRVELQDICILHVKNGSDRIFQTLPLCIFCTWVYRYRNTFGCHLKLPQFFCLKKILFNYLYTEATHLDLDHAQWLPQHSPSHDALCGDTTPNLLLPQSCSVWLWCSRILPRVSMDSLLDKTSTSSKSIEQLLICDMRTIPQHPIE